MNRLLRSALSIVLLGVLLLSLAGIARGSDGDPLILGQANSASTTTSLSNDGSIGLELAGAPAIRAFGLDGSSPTIFARESGETTDITSSAGAAIFGVSGADDGGIGVLASSSPTNGVALGVDGRASFTRSGTVRISFPAKSVTVAAPSGQAWGWLKPPYGQEGPKALVLATLQTQIRGVYVAAAVPDPNKGSFTIYLNKAPGTSDHPKSVDVAWFIVN